MNNPQPIPRNLFRQFSAWRPVPALAVFFGLLASPAAWAQTAVWNGAGGSTVTTGWANTANWTPNALPTGQQLLFPAAVSGTSLTSGNEISSSLAIAGLTFNAGDGNYVLGGYSVAPSGTIADNATALQTINFPIVLGASQTFSVVNGGALTLNNVISGSGSLIQTGGGLLTLTGQAAGANTYTGNTTNNAGTLELDFSQGGSTPAANIIPNTSVLALRGGELLVNGAAATADTQTFAGVTLNPGQNIITAVNGSGGGTATVALNALTVTPGASVVFYGPASSTGKAAATGTITTTTAGLGQTTAGEDGILETAANNNAYATVGLYDWATTDSGAITAGTTVVGGSSVSGFYVVPGNNANPSGTPNWDIATQQTVSYSTVSTARLSSTTAGAYTVESVRFNTGIAPYLDVKGGYYFQPGGLLVTPNLGVINVGVCNVRLNNSTCQIVQNNTTAVLVIGIDSTSTSIWQAFTAASASDTSDNVVKSGPGTLFLNPVGGTRIAINYTNSGSVYAVSGSGRVNAGTYDSVDVANTTPAAFYFNGGVTVINNGNQLGNPATLGATAGAVGTVNLNGGTLMGALNSFYLTNGVSGGAARPVFLGANGGGLAAQTTNTFYIPGVISSSSGNGPLTIGIPASSANGNNVGLVPGTGAVGTYYTTNPPFYANGTVALTNVNTYTGNTVIASGTLQLAPSGSIANSGNIIVGAGATFDASQVIGGFTLGGVQPQNLMGYGSVTGAVLVASGSGIFGGQDGTYGTNTFNSSLTLAAGAAAYFDLGTKATGSNDLIVVNGNLTFNGNVIHLKAPSTSVLLDTAGYLLFTNTGTLTVNGTLTFVWDVPPANAANFIVAESANSVTLQYVTGSGPIIASATATPNPAYPNETVLLSALVLTNGYFVNSVTADVSQTAGTGAAGSGATTEPLYLSAIPNVYTNSMVVGAAVPTNTTTANIITAVDTSGNTTRATNILSITTGAPTITASASPNPVGLSQLLTISATVLGNSYPIGAGGVTVNVSAISGTSPLTLVLSGTPNVYTNSCTVANSTAFGPQTLTVSAQNTGPELNTATVVVTVAPRDVWTGLGADNNWSTGGNWLSGLIPNTGDYVTFAGGNWAMPDMNNNYSLGALTFGPAAQALNIVDPTASYTLTMTGGVTNNSPNVQTVSVPVALTGAPTFTMAAGGLVLSNILSDDARGLTVAGTNTLTLEATNTYTGPTTITAATLAIAGAGQLNGGIYASNISDNGVLNYGSTATQTLSGVVSGSGFLQTGPGTLTLSGANSYGGGTVINGGLVQVQNATAFGVGNLTNNGGSILLEPTAGLTIANNVWVTGTTFFDQNNYIGNNNFSGSIGGNGTMIVTNLATSGVTSYSTMTLAGVMTNFTGHIVCAPVASTGNPSAGFLRFNSGSVVNLGSPQMSVDLGSGSSAVILCTRNGETASVGELLGGVDTAVEGCRNAGVTIWSIGGLNTTTTYYGTIENADGSETIASPPVLIAGLTKVGTGTLFLAGQSTYTGSTVVSNGVLALTNNVYTSQDGNINGTTNIFINTGATLDLSGLNTPTLTLSSGQFLGGGGTVNATANGTVNVDNANLTPGNGDGTGALTVIGNLFESSAINYITVTNGNSSGFINVQGNLDLSSGTQTIQLSEPGGAAVPNGTYQLFTYTGTLNGGLANLSVIPGGNFSFNSQLINNTAVNPHQINVVITPARAPTTLVWLGNVNGDWDFISDNWVNGATSYSFESGDSVIFNDAGDANTYVALQDPFFPGSVLVSNSVAGAYTFTGTGTIDGTTGLTKTNNGTLTIQTVNSYTGPTVIGGGTISIADFANGGAPSAIGSSSTSATNLVFYGGTLAYTGSSITNNRNVTLNAPGGTFDVAGGVTLGLSGVLGGPGPFIVTDSGTLVVTGANTYTNGTIVAGNSTLIFSVAAAIPATGPLTLTNNGNVIVQTANSLPNVQVYGVDSITGNGNSGTGAATLNDQGALTLMVIGNSAVFDLTGTMTGSGSLTLGSAAMTLRFNGSTGDSNAVFNLGTGSGIAVVRNTAPAIALGGLEGGSGTSLVGNNSSAPNVTYTIGGANTNTEFDGVIKNGSAGGIAIVKVGTGTQLLTGINTYTGSTTVSNGVLALGDVSGTDAALTGTTNINISAGAIVDVSGNYYPVLAINAGQTLSGNGMVSGSVGVTNGIISPGSGSGNATLTITNDLFEAGANNYFTLSAPGNADTLTVQSNLDVSTGVQNIFLTQAGGGAIASGVYPLFTYGGSLIGGLANLDVVAIGFTATLTNITSVTPSQIAVIITPAGRAATNLVWVGDGAANNWDFVTANWLAGATRYAFIDGDSVTFNDAGDPNTTVTLQNSFYPAALVVSNSVAGAYTFTGSGSINGATGLVKTNNGTLTILNNNDYTGPTVLGGGIIAIPSVALGGVPSPLGAASNLSTNLVFAGGTLAYTGSTAATDRGALLNGAGGTIDVVNGTVLTLNGIITGSGPLTLTDSGQLTLTAANTFTGNIVINGGLLSDDNVQNVNTPAVGGLGNPQIAGRTVTINNGGTLSLDVSGGNEFGGGETTDLLGYIINAGGLMQITSGNATIGPVTLNGGTLSSTASANTGTQYGAFEFTADITAGGTTPSTIQSQNGAPDCLTVDSLVLNRTFTVTNVNGVLNVTAVLCNSGGTQTAAGLVKTGPGTMTLSAVNVYTGSTTVSNGTLLVNSGGSISTAPVYIAGGVLGGSGTIYGAVTNQAGGTLAPGAEISSPGTTLTCNSNVTLQLGSTTRVQVAHNAYPDQITVGGTLTYGGILMVATNAGDSTPYQVGDQFTLFNLNGGSYSAGSSFATIQPPPGPGLGWSGANLGVNGSIQVVAASAVTANFTQTTGSGTLPLAVTFNNTSSGATYWVWNFGDGSTLLTTSNTNVPHTYTTAGSFTVVLTAYGPGGTSTKTVAGAVVVTYPAPVAAFSGTPTNLFVTQSVTFTDASTGTITNWLWNLGDGSTVTNSSSANVVHTYMTAGTYTVSLTVSGPGGVNTSTRTAYVVAEPKPTLNVATLANGSLVFSGVNGPVGAQYRILNSTNLTVPLANWNTVWVSTFASPNGGFSYTNAPGTNAAGFFLLVSP